ncbi:MAG TPA: galactokinase [Dermatophilaceae bacterium]|nr:galactokinase [Dermatophilaceae bacterium]
MGATWLGAPDDATVVPALEAAFAVRYGHPPEGVWSAPGRVNIIGDHTDYNGGLCLPMALPHRTYVAAGRRADGVIRVASLQDDHAWEGGLSEVGPGRPAGWEAYVLGVLWALGQRGLAVPGLDLLVDGHVPVGSGLSSSAALSCSVAVAMTDLVPGADELTRKSLAGDCVLAENVVAGARTGGLDQTIALRGARGHALLIDCRDFTTVPVPWSVEEAGWTLVVFDTRAPHSLVDGQYAARRDSCEKAAGVLGVGVLGEVPESALGEALERLADDVILRRTRHVVTEIARVRRAVAALRDGDVPELGRLMTESHRSLRNDFEVSTPELDLVVEVALAEGAAGARMTGGGFGGSAIALVPTDSVKGAADAVAAAFAERGWQTPLALLATASGPAARTR